MFLLTSVRRSPQSIPAIRTLQFRSFCASPPPELASGVDLKSPQDESRSFYKFFSKFALAASIGTIGYYSYQYASSSDKPFAPFANWSKDATSPDESCLDQDQPSSTRFLFAETYRRRIFFNYEKRIRMRSSPEKVFEYFASYRTPEGEIVMTPDDLMRAVVPVFPPSESNLVRDGYLRGERSPGHLRCTPSELFMLFDMNGDGLISFKEYVFFVTLLSIPETSFTVAFKMFDSDCNGEIDREEFKKVMALMRSHNRQGTFHSNGRRPGMKVDGAVEDGGLVEYFFGEDGKQRLEYGKFVNFLRSLHDEMVKLEFAHYDYKLRRTLSAKDFALSIVASADMRHLSKLLDRVEEMSKDSEFGNVRITFEEFKSFADLRKQLQSFSLALFTYGKANGLLTRDDFQRAASQVCGISLTDNVVDIIFHIFDTNRDGSLSSAELLRVLHKRESDIAHPTEAGMMNFLSCCWNCSDNSASLISRR